MNSEKLFKIMGDINDHYVADAYKKKTKKNLFLKLLVAVITCLFILFVIIVPFENSSIGELSVQAKDLGKEEYQFGVALPEIIYSDSDKVILYDFRGLYVYSFASKKLIGYVDFRKLGMDKIQGDNSTFLNVIEDGYYVRFYNNSQKCIFDVEKNSYTEVSDYKDDLKNQYQITIINFGEENSISDEQITYVGVDGSYLAVEIDQDNLEDGIARYKNMYILRENEDVSKRYYIFE